MAELRIIDSTEWRENRKVAFTGVHSFRRWEPRIMRIDVIDSPVEWNRENSAIVRIGLFNGGACLGVLSCREISRFRLGFILEQVGCAFHPDTDLSEYMDENGEEIFPGESARFYGKWIEQAREVFPDLSEVAFEILGEKGLLPSRIAKR